jgi:hypothetical protein
VDDENRKLKKAWKLEQSDAARAAFPLGETELAALFAAVEASLDLASCDHTLRHVLAWLAEHGHVSDAIVVWLKDNGGYCDCEVVANVRDHWEQNRR